MMDMVFSDTGDLHGGFYDNNAGVDYHVPISGASVTRPPLRIAHVSVEMAPIAKVGSEILPLHSRCLFRLTSCPSSRLSQMSNQGWHHIGKEPVSSINRCC